jgi:hypothetical protein
MVFAKGKLVDKNHLSGNLEIAEGAIAFSWWFSTRADLSIF